MKKVKQILMLLIIALLMGTAHLVKAQADWNTLGNAIGPGQFLGSTNNQPFNIKTNNLLRATFTTGNAFGSGSTAGDGLKILDPSGGPGNLELWTSSSTQSHIRWSKNGLIQAKSSRFEIIGNFYGLWYNTTSGAGRYVFNRQDKEVGRIGTNNKWRIGLNPGDVDTEHRLEVIDKSSRPQFRISYTESSNVNMGTNADFHVSDHGNLHIVPRLDGATQAVAIGFFDDPSNNTDPLGGTFLDVGKGRTRLRKLPKMNPNTLIIGYQFEDVNKGPEDYFLGRLDFPEDDPECFVLNGEGEWVNICEGIIANDCRWEDIPSYTIMGEKDMMTAFDPQDDCYRGKIGIGTDALKTAKLNVLNTFARDEVLIGIHGESQYIDGGDGDTYVIGVSGEGHTTGVCCSSVVSVGVQGEGRDSRYAIGVNGLSKGNVDNQPEFLSELEVLLREG